MKKIHVIFKIKDRTFVLFLNCTNTNYTSNDDQYQIGQGRLTQIMLWRRRNLS